MTLIDILTSDLSDYQKVEMSKIFLMQKGGNIEQNEKKDEESPTQSIREKLDKPVKKLNPTETISVGGKEYDVEVADTEAKRADGLSRVNKLASDEGMLFIHEQPTTDYYTMKDTSIDLDIVFIDGDGEVIEVKPVKAFDPDPVVCDTPFEFVLEVNINSGIKKGDELDQDEDLSDEDKNQVKKSRMLVLDSDGNVQMRLQGGERIVSMIKTRQFVKAALKAYRTDEDSDYRRVGKLIFKELDAQDSRDPEYVEKKD